MDEASHGADGLHPGIPAGDYGQLRRKIRSITSAPVVMTGQHARRNQPADQRSRMRRITKSARSVSEFRRKLAIFDPFTLSIELGCVYPH
jgi:hypothetical protein